MDPVYEEIQCPEEFQHSEENEEIITTASTCYDHNKSITMNDCIAYGYNMNNQDTTF